MRRSLTFWRAAALGLGTVMTLAACGSSIPGRSLPMQAGTEGSGMAAEAPAGFKPCDDLPQSFIDSARLKGKILSNSSASGGIEWRGCQWTTSDIDVLAIHSTNITLDMVRWKKFAYTRDLVIDGRQAVVTRQLEDTPDECLVNVELKGGSLEIVFDGFSSSRGPAALDSCDLAVDLAQQLAPSLPAMA
ncbi:DUF3558 domain-containing protein [Nocardia callitridis]|uniref:DUF3558 domain-containing protein n=1 Tax=Nocardia callitridis TaxID=648753 RepID=A0ABP9L311_9NOCA